MIELLVNSRACTVVEAVLLLRLVVEIDLMLVDITGLGRSYASPRIILSNRQHLVAEVKSWGSLTKLSVFSGHIRKELVKLIAN